MRGPLSAALAGLILAGGGLLAPSLAGATPVLFGVTFLGASDPTGDQLLRLDTTTGAGSVVGNLGVDRRVLGLGTWDNHLYAYASATGQLLELDPATGQTLDTVGLGVFTGEGGLDFRSDGTGFLVHTTGSTAELLSFQIGSPQVTPVAGGLPRMDGLAFQPGTDALFGISQTTYVLYVIDPSNGAVTEIGRTGISSQITLSGLAFAPDGTLFLATAGQLYTLDPTDGAATSVGATGFSNVSGLTFVDVPEGEPIPEPATALLLGGGLLGLAWRTRRRRV
jgi:outer membrane protein assembly factor BamB